MRWGAAVLMVVVAAVLTGCTSGTAAVQHSTAAAPATSAAPTPTPAASLTADGTFAKPIVCRAVFDYETVQAAIATGKLATVHLAGTAAAKDDAAGLASERAHTWASSVQPLLQPYFAAVAQQVVYYQAVAAAKTVDEATALQWPDATDVSSPVYSAVGITGSLTCPTS